MTNTKEEVVEYINKFIAEVNYATELGPPSSYINGETVLVKLHTILDMVQNEVSVGMNIKERIIYYSIVNTIDDRTRGETGRYETYEEAKEDLKNQCDWYREKGTGTIYEITEELDITELGFKITRTKKQMLKK